MPFLARSLILWLILLGCCVLFPWAMPARHATEPEQWQLFLGLFSLPLAVLATVWASLRPAGSTPARVIFWTITGVWWLLVLLLLSGGLHRQEIQGRLPIVGILLAVIAAVPVVVQFALFRPGVPARHRGWFYSLCGGSWLIVLLAGWGVIDFPAFIHRHEEWKPAHHLYLSAQLGLTILVAAQLHLRRWPSRQTLREAAAGLSLVLLIALVTWMNAELQLRSQRRRAVAAWERLGQPLAGFGEKLVAVKEGPSVAYVESIVNEWQHARLPPDPRRYGSSPKIGILARPDGKLPSKIPFSWPLADDFELRVRGFGGEEENFRRSIRRILEAEQPVYRWMPGERTPLVSTLRGGSVFNELAALYTAQRLAAGDEEGARDSLMAVYRLNAALPDAEGFPLRLGFAHRMEAWHTLAILQAHFAHWDDSPTEIQRDFADGLKRLTYVYHYHAWRRLHQQWYERFPGEEASFAALSPMIQRVLNIWESQMEGAQTAHKMAWPLRPSALWQHLGGGRAMLFTNAYEELYQVSLLREQGLLIRAMRARLPHGPAPENRPCVTIPGATWELRFDPVAYTLTIVLASPPPWVVTELGKIPPLTWQYRRPAAPAPPVPKVAPADH